MTTRDIIEETYAALSGNKVRSSLTILGIVIGIGSVIAMIAIGQGASASIQSRIQSIGSNLVLVTPGAARTTGAAGVNSGRGASRTLTQADADAIAREVTSAKAVAPEITGRYQVTSKGLNTNTSIVGTTASYSDIRNIQIDEGMFISPQNVTSLSKVAVLGPAARDDLFASGTDAIGKTIRIKGMEFKVIGIAVAKGGTGFGNQDDQIYIPISSAQRFLAGASYVTTISIQAQSAEEMTAIQQQVTELLLLRHNISDPTQADFSVLNQADIVATASSITQTFTILLAAVAGISLIVGGIGIMNMMLTSVTERTKEIGLRKAIGAKNRDISIQFLAEAVTLTFLGGIIGVLLGISISYGITYFGILATSVSLSSILLAFGVSTVIGIVFGYYPARHAASLNPIEALRFE